jgi:endonuclease/exonuclease/phosphatase family metal-dependent hydrolase
MIYSPVTTIIKPGQCFIKRHNYQYMDRSQFYGIIENNDSKFEQESSEFIKAYGPYKEHAISIIDIKLINLPYPSADDGYESNPTYAKEFKEVFAKNAHWLIEECLNRHDTANIIDPKKLHTIINNYVLFLYDISPLKTFIPLDNERVFIPSGYDVLFYRLSAISAFFLLDPSVFFEYRVKDLYRNLTLGDIIFYNNSDYTIIDFLDEINHPDIDGWIRLVFLIDHKKAQEIALLPKSISSVNRNDGCNCKLVNNICNTHTYDYQLDYVSPTPKDRAECIRILSYNVHMWTSYGQLHTSSIVYGIMKNINAINPDIISFQEDDGMLGSQNISRTTYVDEYSEMYVKFLNIYTEFPGCKYDDKLWCSVYIKKSLLEKYNVEIINAADQNIKDDEYISFRCATIMKITNKIDSTDSFVFVNTHISSDVDAGADNFKKLMEILLPHIDNIPIILTGDMNSYSINDYNENEHMDLCQKKEEVWKESNSKKCDAIFFIDKYLMGESKQFKDVFHDRSIKITDTSIYGGRIDYIAGNKELYKRYDITHAQQIRDWSSDHTPIFADFLLKPKIHIGGSNKFKYANNKMKYYKLMTLFISSSLLC